MHPEYPNQEFQQTMLNVRVKFKNRSGNGGEYVWAQRKYLKSHCCQDRGHRKQEWRTKDQSFENAFIDEEEKGQVGNETKECQRDRRCYGLNGVPIKRYFKVLIPSTSECAFIGKWISTELTRLR